MEETPMKLTKPQKAMLEFIVIKTKLADGDESVEMEMSKRKVCENLAKKKLIVISKIDGGHFYARVPSRKPPVVLSKEQDKYGWFSVQGAGVPTQRGRYLLHLPSECSSSMDGLWDGDDFWVDGILRTKAVTHWQPLPPDPEVPEI
jgi:hypothetical protein